MPRYTFDVPAVATVCVTATDYGEARRLVREVCDRKDTTHETAFPELGNAEFTSMVDSESDPDLIDEE